MLLQPTAEHQGSGPAPGTQLRPSASGSSLALPAGINPEDIAEGSIRFFHDDLCLSIPFKGEHFMSSEAIKALSPRELILIYEVRSPLSIIMSPKSCCSPTSIYSRVRSLVGVTDCVVLALGVHAGLCLWGTCLAFSKPGKVWHHDVLTKVMVQRYVEQLRRCLQSEASEQPLPNASVGVVKLANEIVSPLPTLSCCCYQKPIQAFLHHMLVHKSCQICVSHTAYSLGQRRIGSTGQAAKGKGQPE